MYDDTAVLTILCACAKGSGRFFSASTQQIYEEDDKPMYRRALFERPSDVGDALDNLVAD